MIFEEETKNISSLHEEGDEEGSCGCGECESNLEDDEEEVEGDDEEVEGDDEEEADDDENLDDDIDPEQDEFGDGESY